MRCGSRSCAAPATTRILGQHTEYLAVAVVGEQCGIEAVARQGDSCIDGVTRSAQPGVGILHVIDRVLAAGLGDLLDIKGQRGIGRVTRQGVPQSVDADHLDQLRQRDDVAGPLGQPHLLAATQDLDQLTDRDLDVELGVIACAGNHRLEPADVTVVIGPSR